MKKVLCLVLCMVVITTSVAFASTPQTLTYESKTKDSTVILEKKFDSSSKKYFAIETKNSAMKEVEYSYQFRKTNDSEADVELEFLLSLGEKVYPAIVTGHTSLNIFPSGEKLWEGPLDGQIVIDDAEYEITVGFAKMDNSPDVQCGVTIGQALKKETIGNNPPFIAFSFGENVITSNIVNELKSSYDKTVKKTEFSVLNNQKEAVQRGSDTLALLDSELARFESNNQISGYGQRARLYFANASGRVAVGSKSYCSNVTNFYAPSYKVCFTTIAEHKISLSRGNDDASKRTFIGNIERPQGLEEGKENVLLAPLFEDIMAALNIPSSIIMATVGSLKGKVVKTLYADHASMNFTYSLSNSVCYDDSAVGTPVVFALTSNDDDAKAKYTYSTTYRYRTLAQSASSGATSFYYTNAKPVSKSVTLQFDFN